LRLELFCGLLRPLPVTNRWHSSAKPQGGDKWLFMATRGRWSAAT
jgi:hypothetical protein